METQAPWTSGSTMPPIWLADRDRDREREIQEELERRRRQEEAEERRRQIDEERKRNEESNVPTDQDRPKNPRSR